MKKISIVIPVYNVEKYIKKCLDSIVNQAYKLLEIIIVNDGSTDDSEKIINEYVNKYKNIVYYKKKNGGLSDARNYGAKMATGDYICFIDPDDYIDSNLFEKLKNEIDSNCDIIKFKAIKVDENYNEIERVDGPVFSEKNGCEAFNILYGEDVLIQPAVLYLYRKFFWEHNGFEYPVGKYHEDFARTVLIIVKAKTVVSTDIFGYYYVQSSNSITRGNDEKKKMDRAMDLLEHYDYMMENINSYGIDKYTIENVKIYYTNCIILKLKELSKENKKIYLDEIKKRQMFKNIKIRNFKQFCKKILLLINVEWYLKIK